MECGHQEPKIDDGEGDEESLTFHAFPPEGPLPLRRVCPVFDLQRSLNPILAYLPLPMIKPSHDRRRVII